MENPPAEAEEKWMEKLIRVRYIYNTNNNSMNNAAQLNHSHTDLNEVAAGKA